MEDMLLCFHKDGTFEITQLFETFVWLNRNRLILKARPCCSPHYTSCFQRWSISFSAEQSDRHFFNLHSNNNHKYHGSKKVAWSTFAVKIEMKPCFVFSDQRVRQENSNEPPLLLEVKPESQSSKWDRTPASKSIATGGWQYSEPVLKLCEDTTLFRAEKASVGWYHQCFWTLFWPGNKTAWTLTLLVLFLICKISSCTISWLEKATFWPFILIFLWAVKRICLKLVQERFDEVEEMYHTSQLWICLGGQNSEKTYVWQREEQGRGWSERFQNLKKSSMNPWKGRECTHMWFHPGGDSFSGTFRLSKRDQTRGESVGKRPQGRSSSEKQCDQKTRCADWTRTMQIDRSYLFPTGQLGASSCRLHLSRLVRMSLGPNHSKRIWCSLQRHSVQPLVTASACSATSAWQIRLKSDTTQSLHLFFGFLYQSKLWFLLFSLVHDARDTVSNNEIS